MLTKREKGSILQSNSTMNGKSDKKINKYRATDGWKMQTICSVCSTARFTFMSQYSRGYSFKGTFKIPAQLQENKMSVWQIFWRQLRNCSSCRTSDQKLRPARFPSDRRELDHWSVRQLIGCCDAHQTACQETTIWQKFSTIVKPFSGLKLCYSRDLRETYWQMAMTIAQKLVKATNWAFSAHLSFVVLNTYKQIQ